MIALFPVDFGNLLCLIVRPNPIVDVANCVFSFGIWDWAIRRPATRPNSAEKNELSCCKTPPVTVNLSEGLFQTALSKGRYHLALLRAGCMSELVALVGLEFIRVLPDRKMSPRIWGMKQTYLYPNVQSGP